MWPESAESPQWHKPVSASAGSRHSACDDSRGHMRASALQATATPDFPGSPEGLPLPSAWKARVICPEDHAASTLTAVSLPGLAHTSLMWRVPEDTIYSSQLLAHERLSPARYFLNSVQLPFSLSPSLSLSCLLGMEPTVLYSLSMYCTNELQPQPIYTVLCNM